MYRSMVDPLNNFVAMSVPSNHTALMRSPTIGILMLVSCWLMSFRYFGVWAKFVCLVNFDRNGLCDKSSDNRNVSWMPLLARLMVDIVTTKLEIKCKSFRHVGGGVGGGGGLCLPVDLEPTRSVHLHAFVKHGHQH